MSDSEAESSLVERRRRPEGRVGRRRRSRSSPPHSSSDEKLQQILGDYTPSNHKLVKTLGITPEALRELTIARLEEQLEAQRRLGSELVNSNKKTSQKALAMLGINPSMKKAIAVLGCNEDEYHEAEVAVLTEQEEIIRQTRLHRAQIHVKNKRKAFHFLGLDPSAHKASQLLGIEDDEVVRELFREAEHERWQLSEQKIVRRRSHSLSNRRNLAKALEKLGVDPSSSKVQKLLGVSEGQLQEAIREESERVETQISRVR